MKIIVTLFISMHLFIVAQSQAGISVTAGTAFFITSGNIVSIDGLALQPSTSFTLTAPNSLVRNTTVSHAAINPYIQRVYQWSNTVNPFTGSISLYYHDMELNGIPEAELMLNVHNGVPGRIIPPR